MMRGGPREVARDFQHGSRSKSSTSSRSSRCLAPATSSSGKALGREGRSSLLESTLQREIATDFPAAAHVNVSNSGHYIQRDRPTVVVNAARQLAGCAPLGA
jgi:hypothetical protein